MIYELFKDWLFGQPILNTRHIVVLWLSFFGAIGLFWWVIG